jgi:hypothetical protein
MDLRPVLLIPKHVNCNAKEFFYLGQNIMSDIFGKDFRARFEITAGLNAVSGTSTHLIS